MERKLAAVLVADVVGFAGLIASDEEGTLKKLERLFQGNVHMHIDANRGRVFKTVGDGVLAEFSSTIEAVNCAIGIQKMCVRQARELADQEPLQLRIGVSLGDVIVQDGDLLGDGVNVAARLQAMADAGGIAISREVYKQVSGKTEITFKDCGHAKLKDTDAPIHVYKTRDDQDDNAGLFDFDDLASATKLVAGGCLCGAIRYEISQPHIATGYCHCRICQRFTGSVVNPWTAFAASSVRFTNEEPRYFASSPIAERGFCPDCGSSLTYRLMKPQPAGFIAICTASLDNPQDFPPAVHSGLESKMPWFDILDELPRTTCAQSRSLRAAWSSVGLDDPRTWNSITQSKDVD